MQDSGHSKPKLRLQRHEKERDNLASPKVILSHSSPGINYPQRSMSAKAILVSHLPYLSHLIVSSGAEALKEVI